MTNGPHPGGLLGPAAALVVGLLTIPALGDEPAAPAPPSPEVRETMQVTATRLPEGLLAVPASITVVRGSELEARGVHDLAGALALVSGVSIAPGGDGGPASSVPELMGLREFDAFLLVVDDVPWGGAFNPALSTLDLTNIDRIEVLRGAAPVLYGATSFVGVIHVIHRAPDATPRDVGAWGGSYGSYGAGVTWALPGGPRFRHSISGAHHEQGFRDDDTSFGRSHALWNAVADVGNGRLRLSADLTAVRQEPASPHPRQGETLSRIVPLDANHNPSDARIDEDRYHVVAGYERGVGVGTWSTLLAVTHTRRDTVRGFLREDFDLPAGVSNADGFRQDFEGDDVYLDSHWSWQRDPALSAVAGVDLLAGRGETRSMNFEYHVALDGDDVPSSRSATIDERPEFEDERLFGGAYAQVLWSATPRWRVDAGIRLNVTDEKQEGEVEEAGGEVTAHDSRSDTRLSGSVGASFRAWQGDAGSVWVFADYKDAFKPAAVDFGPEAEGEILDPETARTYEIGLKGTCGEARLFWQASAYRMDFDNLVIGRTVMGLPSLTNAGTQRFEGVEGEARWEPRDDLTVQGSFAVHSAKFRDYVAEFDGTPTQLAGNRLEMSPEHLGSLGLTWAPEHGFMAWAAGNYVGSRPLNKRNTSFAGRYATLSLGGGYRFDRFDVRVEVDNLNDRRDPVSEAELGDAQYYRLPARSVRFGVAWHL